MREIKFRAWNKKKKKMFTLCGLDWGYGCAYYDNGIMINDIDFRDIILEQYTGLCDKNGKEIYEGDIDEARLTVFFNDGKFYWGDPDGGFEEELCEHLKYDKKQDKYYLGNTIIGNIHEEKSV